MPKSKDVEKNKDYIGMLNSGYTVKGKWSEEDKQRLKDAVQKMVESEDIPFNTGDTYEPWTQEDKDRLGEALIVLRDRQADPFDELGTGLIIGTGPVTPMTEEEIAEQMANLEKLRDIEAALRNSEG